MKWRLATLLPTLLLLTFSLVWGQGIGAYFTLVNTYFYTKGARAGNRYLVRPRLAFTVVDLTTDEQEVIWYRVIYPAKTVKVSGEGWTPTAPHEILSAEQNRVLVFSRIPDNVDQPFSVFRVPVAAVELLNESNSNGLFAQVDWQKVKYDLEEPLLAWARGSAGIYRPNKSKRFLTRVYGELVTRVLDKEKQIRLLSGVVRIGDDLKEVNWALGKPLHSQEEEIGNAKRTTWQYPEMTVVFENGVVKQIN